MDENQFGKACDEVIGMSPGLNGIGTLGEKTIHSVIKRYLSPDSIYHEVKIAGFVADIFDGSHIIEIQTRDFNKLRKKLSAFLKEYPVTIVYPAPAIKWLRWVNPETGEITSPRKSPKVGACYSVFPELYKIKDFLTEPGLSLKIMMIDMEEYRYLDGWSRDRKRGSTRCDRLPVNLADEIVVAGIRDYQKLIPASLDSEFTSKDFKSASGLSLGASQTALNVLNYVGAVERTGKSGRAYLYTRA